LVLNIINPTQKLRVVEKSYNGPKQQKMKNDFILWRGYPSLLYFLDQFGLQVTQRRNMGYWQSARSRWLDIVQVLFCEFLDRDVVEVHKLAKRERGQCPAILTEQAWTKGSIIWLSGKFFLRDTAGSPEQARWLHLAHSGSQSQRRIWLIFPACGASHTIIHIPTAERQRCKSTELKQTTRTMAMKASPNKTLSAK